jgi:hypothetical protein
MTRYAHRLKTAGSRTAGKLVTTEYPDGRKLTLEYATVIEGKIV